MYVVAVDMNKCRRDGACIIVRPQSVFKIECGTTEPVFMAEYLKCLTCIERIPQQAITVSET